MYFADLTPYQYGLTAPEPGVVNVGWLSSICAHPKGSCPDEFVVRLEQLVRSPIKLHRGRHVCELCPPPPVIMRNGQRFVEPLEQTMGNGQIRITGRDGSIFAAPVLIVHYIKEHDYLPPKQFIEAVLDWRG
jgi:hypothetical protein